MSLRISLIDEMIEPALDDPKKAGLSDRPPLSREVTRSILFPSLAFASRCRIVFCSLGDAE
jgi:hypothetical protein